MRVLITQMGLVQTAVKLPGKPQDQKALVIMGVVSPSTCSARCQEEVIG